jgi:preprotein translocase subunit SecF
MSTDTKTTRDSRERRPKKRHKIAWASVSVFILFAAIAIYAALHQGVREMNFPGGGSISFQNVKPAEIQKSQPAIKSDLSIAEARAQQQGVQSASVPDIAGYWRSNYGLTYLIQQYGDRVVMQEQSPYGITGVAEGTVSESSASLNFKAINGTVGNTYLTFQGDGTMNARFDNLTLNTSINAVLTRQ